jgi:hypothetical protein
MYQSGSVRAGLLEFDSRKEQEFPPSPSRPDIHWDPAHSPITSGTVLFPTRKKGRGIK